MTRLNFQKFLILKGSRGTGKSVVIHMFEKVIGTGNYSNVPLQKLEEKFYSIQLLGKLLNLCADINASPMKTVNTIKLITGGDSLTDSYKGRDVVTFEPYARLFFSCNAIPLSLDEKSNALFERIILIEMDNRPEKPDRQLIIKIQNEMPYIIQQGLKVCMNFWKATSCMKVHVLENWSKNYILIVILSRLLFVSAYKGILKLRLGQKNFLTVTKNIARIQRENH